MKGTTRIYKPTRSFLEMTGLTSESWHPHGHVLKGTSVAQMIEGWGQFGESGKDDHVWDSMYELGCPKNQGPMEQKREKFLRQSKQSRNIPLIESLGLGHPNGKNVP